jgi:hypothetical protein
MKIRKGNILIDNTKQLKEENIQGREKEKGPHLCTHTSKGGTERGGRVNSLDSRYLQAISYAQSTVERQGSRPY